uniref:Uncharacterized protein n=1 Tax=Cucumis sativus TaxID=3659 RepID=A0A0A0L357_CUCSA
MCADVLSSSSALIDMLITAYGTVLLRDALSSFPALIDMLTAYGTVLLRLHCWKSMEEFCFALSSSSPALINMLTAYGTLLRVHCRKMLEELCFASLLLWNDAISTVVMAPLRVSSGENSTPLADDTSITILMFNARFNLPSLHFGSCAAAAYNLRWTEVMPRLPTAGTYKLLGCE